MSKKKLLIGGFILLGLLIGNGGSKQSTTQTAAVQSPTPSVEVNQDKKDEVILTPDSSVKPAPSLSPSPSPSPSPTPTPTPKPSVKPSPTVTPSPKTGGTWACSCSKTCDEMISCAEAQYQLKTCGCTRRDADHDGIACDAQCQ